MKPGARSRPASAPTSSKGLVCICLKRLTAITSRFWACRCCRCLRSCAANTCWAFKMIVLGLTGSIGMGKSTTAQLFAEAGVPVYDADAAVHRLYEGEAVPVIEAAFPGTTENGKVDRNKLSARVVHDPAAMKKLEEIVHPILGASRQEFFRKAEQAGAPVVVIDIPLLFETGGEARVDAVVVVTTHPDVQRQRIL